MSDFLRLLLLLVLAGCVVTVAASGAAWWMEEQRRLTRLIRRTLGGPPDAQIIAHGRNVAAAIKLDTEQAVVMWKGGSKALLYPLDSLLGAELIVDHVVVGRVFRGEPRKPLDAVNRDAEQVTLRLIFNNPRDPDFELDLWGPRDNEGAGPASAIQEARTWIARADAILRRPGAEPSVATKQVEPREEPKIEDIADIEDEDDDEPPF